MTLNDEDNKSRLQALLAATTQPTDRNVSTLICQRISAAIDDLIQTIRNAADRSATLEPPTAKQIDLLRSKVTEALTQTANATAAIRHHNGQRPRTPNASPLDQQRETTRDRHNHKPTTNNDEPLIVAKEIPRLPT